MSKTTTEFDVPARAWTDDRAVSVDFDAAEWLRTADLAKLRALDACGWRGDYGSDQVALDLAESNDELRRLFQYIEAVNVPTRETIGFEVSVDEDAALAWLESHRSIARKLTDD
jgi:hypothetical protein